MYKYEDLGQGERTDRARGRPPSRFDNKKLKGHPGLPSITWQDWLGHEPTECFFGRDCLPRKVEARLSVRCMAPNFPCIVRFGCSSRAAGVFRVARRV